MMSMTFEASSTVTLLFDFWDVHGPAGMVLSVFVVLLLTVLYELLKVWRIWLGKSSRPLAHQPPFVIPPPFPSPYSPSSEHRRDSRAVLHSSPSESSLVPNGQPPVTTNSWLLHGIQTLLHILQVTLGYMLMLCVMSYNTWIFLGVIVGSALGYFIAFPLVGQISAKV
ncbi:probable low affinity copper uptake protein 2 isoform X2 [Lampris incognitus]|uniref:probable low affinity copper uptake protein 2 isoform X2 n=1 Tax=Lampris incognitus TaxID=2546036 RepID=UPI0024B50A1B|nr:probable low affinity copper uptake protein 2 isoform X2 [Lampris incognitus]